LVVGDSLNNLHIRLATRSDLEAICGIEEDSFSDPYPQLLLSRLLREHTNRFLVAEVSSRKLVGYCVCSKDGALAHLVSIGVLREYRKRGVGSALIQTLLAEIGPRVRELWLEVNAANEEAIRFYEGFDFRKVMIIENYYADGAAALRMRLPLDRKVESHASSSRRH
jgi:ribosomal-protein-alanine N-acetyltransferase